MPRPMISTCLMHFSRRGVLFGGTVLGLSGLTGQAGDQNAASVHVLRAREARLRGTNQPPTPVSGFDGVVPGPTIRVRRGEETRVRLTNELRQPIAVHWHGVRVANAMDGVPSLTQPPVGAGASFDYRFSCADAGTFWYHASNWPEEGGLCGLFLVEEVQPVAVDRDVALLIQDWPSAADRPDANPPVSPNDSSAKTDPHLTANGLPRVDIAVRTNERIRLRLVNATDRLLSVRLERHRAWVMALDGQPAEPFLARDARVFLGPGNRTDLFVDATLEPGARAPITVETEAGTAEIARLAYAAGGAARAAPVKDPGPLPANPLPARMEFAKAVRVDLPIAVPNETVWPLRNLDTDGAIGRPLLSLRRGRTVMIAIPNRMAAPAVLHVHGHSFRLLDRLDDGWKPFWLDTLVVPEGQTARIAFVADNLGKWLIAARMLGSPRSAMATWFEVI